MHKLQYSARDIATKYLEFFKTKGHKIIPSSSLIPGEESSVLFNIAGMQPLMPYFFGKKHPQGTRLANIQKCLRTVDIDDVGDDTHCTFFEMLGNWSLGDYFKNESIAWSWEFLTSPNWLNLDPRLISVTVFEGDNNAPRDEESAAIWKSIGIPDDRIAYMGANDNWWAVGPTGPCGPDTEIFYWVGKEMPPVGSNKKTDSNNWMEIWNNVFIEFNRINSSVLERLPQKNVDTGMGLERITTTINRVENIYATDLFFDVMEKIKKLVASENGIYQEKSARIIADHLRASVHLISDGVIPKNVAQGYILRRLIRRAIREAYKMNLEKPFLAEIGLIYIDKFKNIYDSINNNIHKITGELKNEEIKFAKTLKRGISEFEKIVKNKNIGDVVSGKEAFILFETYGFPIEMTIELAAEKNLLVDEVGYKAAVMEHQEKSRTAIKGIFKGGLTNNNNNSSIILHTICHLMLAGLRSVLGNHIYQAGSNISPERIRFDFTHSTRLTEDQVKKIEDYVNEKITGGFIVVKKQESKESARMRGVVGSFWDKYPDFVQIYQLKGNSGEIYSEELCGGPHIEHSNKDMGRFKIIKEEGASSGIRRIKAVLM